MCPLRQTKEQAMKALVVYESIFGNTKAVAWAIAEGLRESMEVDIRAVGGLTGADLTGVGLLVAGGPTHAFGMSRESTIKDALARKTAKQPVEEGSRGAGLRAWLATLPDGNGVPAAAFDTRIRKKGFLSFGQAARGIGSELQKHGYRLVTEGRGFYVTGTEGPLADGELDRARAHGRELAAKVVAPAVR
jgi:hypothetical protein